MSRTDLEFSRRTYLLQLAIHRHAEALIDEEQRQRFATNMAWVYRVDVAHVVALIELLLGAVQAPPRSCPTRPTRRETPAITE